MIDLALVKQQLRITHDDEDLLLQQFIDDATLEVEKLSGQLLDRREVTDVHESFDCWLPLYWGPDPDEVTVSYLGDDEVTGEVTDAVIAKGRIYPLDTWPTIAANTAVEVTYTAGWEEAPADLVGAVLVLVAGMNTDREGAYEQAHKAAAEKCAKRRRMQA